MRLPDTPPDLARLFHDDPSQVRRAVAALLEPQRLADDYLHWDDLRRRTPPEGFDVRGWWATLKLMRSAAQRTWPLADEAGRSFCVNVPDEATALLRRIDLALGGQISVSDPALGDDDRRLYLRRSLEEEALESSLMEGAATTRAVGRELLRTGRPPTSVGERMIRNSLEALDEVRTWGDSPWTPARVLGLHALVTDGTLSDPADAGRLRGHDDVVVRDVDGELLHQPPPAASLQPRLEAMCAFANGDTPGGSYLHPVVRSILLHFWLVWDHPFVDGNGRTARALFYASMLRHRYWVVEYLPISRKLHQAPAQYARAFLLTETDGRDATYFLLHQLRVLVAALDDLDAHVARSRHKTLVMVRTLQLEGVLNPRQLALVEHARAHPGAAFTVRAHERTADVSYPTARSDLLDLEARGVFHAWMRGRERVFVAATDLDAALRALRSR